MRTVLFWIHLSVGCTAGLVILMMSLTGVLLTYERQVIARAESGIRSIPVGKPLSPEELLAKLRDLGQPLPASLTLRKSATEPVEINSGRDRILYIDAYSGAVLGQPAKRTREFFHKVTEWHRWFAAEGSSRGTARSITGACNLGFLLLTISGLWLWMPRRWTWQHVKAVLFFRASLSGKARDFNWHNVIGIWCSFPLIAITVSGLVMSYPWANNLVYQLTGSEVPKPQQRPGPPSERPRDAPFDTAGVNAAWDRATQTVPRWQAITFRIPNSPRAPWTLAIEESHRGRPDLRSSLVLDRTTAEVVSHERFETLSTGRRVRSWLRFVHTGEAGGVVGQTLAGLASLGACVLVWTGISLALRRLRGATTRDSKRTRGVGEYQASA